jgi:predicted Zn-dependent protease
MKRNVPAARSLLWTALAILLMVVLGSPTAQADGPRGRTAGTTHVARPPLVVVRGLGLVASPTLRAACRSLLAAYPVRCEVRASRSVLSVMPAWHDDREQIDARHALNILFRDRSSDALVEIAITAMDIYEQRKPFVFGLASLTDRIALVSVARIDDEPGRLASRLHKLVLHEAGHALGLHHHDDAGCVMRQDPTPASLDHAPRRLCAACHRALVEQAEALSRPGQTDLDRARGHLVRGEAQSAREAFVQALWTGEYDVALLQDFGKAFLDAGQSNEAISVYRYALQLAPDDPQAHVQLGVSYQVRDKRGDRARAISHFERALALRPGWTVVAHHLHGLQRTAPSAQGPASR